MIRIATPMISENGGAACLSAELTVDDHAYKLWFSVDKRYKDYLCYERCDAFALAVFYFAMLYGHDIVSDTPMTDRLHWQLTNQFFLPFCKLNGLSDDPAFVKQGIGYKVKLVCPTAPEVAHPESGHCIGTGLSCGVDSLHVFATHKEITHACVWHAHTMTGIREMDSVEAQTKAWQSMRARAERCAKDIGVEFLPGDTNFAQGCMPGLKWDGMTTFGNLFCIFALQKLWKCYYIASDCDIMNFNMKMKSLVQDPARWEYFLFPHLSLSQLSVYMDGQAHNRVEKVRDLIDYDPAKKFLNVCWLVNDDHKNGTYDCPKCMRTLLNLEVFNAVDKFDEVFDVEYYHSHFHEFLAEYYRCLLHGDNFALEMRPYFSERHYPLSIKVKAWYIVMKKILHKIARLGKTQSGVFHSR